MTAPVWPIFAEISSGNFQAAADPTVRRTPFDDGEIRQELAYTEARLIYSLTVILNSRNRERFDKWCLANQNTEILFQAPTDGKWRLARIRGGCGGVGYRQIGNVLSGPRWEANLTLSARRAEQLSPEINIWTVITVYWLADDQIWVIYT